MDRQNWKAELDEVRQYLVDVCPSYVSNVGPDRVLTRFALAVLAGRIALRNKVLSSELVDETTLLNGVLICIELWIRTRWHYLERLSAALILQKKYLKVHRGLAYRCTVIKKSVEVCLRS